MRRECDRGDLSLGLDAVTGAVASVQVGGTDWTDPVGLGGKRPVPARRGG